MEKRKRILVINPNTSEDMTATIAKSSAKASIPDLVTDVIRNEIGPESIECITDEVITSHGVLSILDKTKNDYDGFIIACFSNHPAIQLGREL